MDRIALYIATTPGRYFELSARCLEIYDTMNPDVFDLFLVCANPSERDVKIAESKGIKILIRDFSSDFTISWDPIYPSECFWWFKMGDDFHDMGYKHSMTVDTDTVCTSKLDFSFLEKDFVLAGSVRMPDKSPLLSYNFLRSIHGNNFDKLISGLRDLGVNFSSVGDCNTGVVIVNNESWVKYEMFNRAHSIFKRCIEIGIPAKGDDSLLSLLQLSTPTTFYHHLSKDWNYFYDIAGSPSKKVDPLIIHCVGHKPWINDNARNINLNAAKNIWNMNKKSSEKVDLWWYRGECYNFGDEITPWLFNKMFSYEQHVPCNLKTSKNPLLAVGSIMRLSNSNTGVWGSGIRDIKQSDFSKAKQVFAVRGRFTRNRLLEMGHDCPEVYGDPGLLLPRYYNPKIEKKYKLGIVPHIVDYDFIVKIFGNNPSINIIDLKTNNIEGVVDEFLKCEHILSTSLHGIITAVAYNIPTRWYQVSNKVNGDGTKFYDFFSSLDADVFNKFNYSKFTSHDEIYDPLKFVEGQTIEELITQTYKYGAPDLDLDKLVRACPVK